VGGRDRQDLLRQPRAERREKFTDPNFRAFVEGFGIVAACVVPLVARGRTIGAMCALQAESGRRFGAETAR
jgi:GAF domain-containing protein